jgi:hypothetical protein
MRWTLEQRRSGCHPISDFFVRRQGRQPFSTGEVDRYSCANEFNAYIVGEVEGGAYAPPVPNFQTGMPSLRALSARFS